MKQFFIPVCLLVILGMSSCGGNDSWDLERAKQELLGNAPISQENIEEKAENTDLQEETSESTQDNALEKDSDTSSVKMKNITTDPIISFDTFRIEDFADLEHKITGKITGKVDSVTVLFTNTDANISMQEPYKLKKFRAGDTAFLYNAFKKYESIAYGLNTYLVTAYEWKKEHKIELQVYLAKPEVDLEEKVWTVDIDNLPKGAQYGNPVKIWEGKVTYSDIKWLEIKNIWQLDLSADADIVTEYLKKTIPGWFYWNTLRPISGEKGVSFYVVSRKKEEWPSVYEKHYYNSDGLYGILTLESNMQSEKPLKELNSQLAERNQNYAQIQAADKLFKDITK